MSRHRRKILIDRPIQFGILLKIASHWCLFLLAVVVMLPFIKAVMGGDFSMPVSERATTAIFDASVLVGVFVILLPYFIYDTFKITNRFAGPMYRLRTAIKEISEGEPSRPLRFRDDDFWFEVAEEFNQMVEKLQIQNDAAGNCSQEQPELEEASV